MSPETAFNYKIDFKLAMLIAIFLLFPAILSSAYMLNKHYLYSQSAEELDNLVEVFISNLKGEIEKFSFLPDVLSADPDINNFMQNPDNAQLVGMANYKLEQINDVSKASDIYIMNTDGVTVAASNWQQQPSFVGENFSYRPYFKQAIAGRQGRYFAYGTTSGQRGYYFSSPIYGAGGSIVGVIAVKVGIARLEQAWKDYDKELLVADENGVVFSTNREQWQFVQLNPLSEQARNQIINDRQYPLEMLKQSRVKITQRLENVEKITISSNDSSVDYLRVSSDIPELNWRVYGMEKSAKLERSIYFRMVVVVFFCGILLALIYAIALRRENLREQLAYRLRVESQLIEARDKLEHRVEKRTKALTLANQDLQLEIDERQKAEQELRQAQDELIHATRLATLGQLSAGITHELSQPLAAINSYAENAISFLENEDYQNANSTIEDILKVCDRMAQITTHLKSFSRRTSDELEQVALKESVNNALALINVRLKERRVDLTMDMDSGLLVVANEVRLEQVFVNLFNNALDAMKDTDDPVLMISQDVRDGFVTTIVSDTGCGIDSENIGSIFDPFFTTKEVGMGLGLGLSISHAIIKKFGGELYAFNNQYKGASFSVRLLRV